MVFSWVQKLCVLLWTKNCTCLLKSQWGLHSALKEQSLCAKGYSESQGFPWGKGTLPATLLKYWIISSIVCQVIIPVHVNCTSMIWYIKRQAGYITCLDLIRTQNPCLFFCVHHFPKYFSCFSLPDEFLYSLPTKSSMQSACPSIILLVHYLSINPEFV